METSRRSAFRVAVASGLPRQVAASAQGVCINHPGILRVRTTNVGFGDRDRRGARPPEKSDHGRPDSPRTDRRQFLRILAASPALRYDALSPTILHTLGQEPFREGGPAVKLIASPEEALTVFDFHAVAKEKLHHGTWRSSAAPRTRGTYRANREGFTQYQDPRPAPGRHQPRTRPASRSGTGGRPRGGLV